MKKASFISLAAVAVVAATAVSLAACGGGYGGGGGGGYSSSSSSSSSVPGSAYKSRDLVADQAATGVNVDVNLKNAWGIAISPTGQVMVTANATDRATTYNDIGTVGGGGLAFSAGAHPTGVVYNNTTAFSGTFLGVNDRTAFLFATEAGTIEVLPQSVAVPGPVRMYDGSGLGADFKGLTMLTGAVDRLYAADFHNKRVEFFDTGFNRITLTLRGGFEDSTLPADYAPFNVQAINGQIYVAYARKDPAGDNPVAGAGFGYIDIFDANGGLVKRLAGNGALNAPWGMAMAPANFGPFSNALLVGNFGDGKINAYDPATGVMLGTIGKTDGTPIVIPGLRGIAFNTNILFYAAGPGNGAHGAYGRLELN